MAVRSTDEIMESIRSRFADDTTDETISLLEDITDTLADKDKTIADSGDWRTRYETNDKEWRERYRNRFFSSGNDPEPDPEPDPDPTPKPKTFNDLFKTE